MHLRSKSVSYFIIHEILPFSYKIARGNKYFIHLLLHITRTLTSLQTIDQPLSFCKRFVGWCFKSRCVFNVSKVYFLFCVEHHFLKGIKIGIIHIIYNVKVWGYKTFMQNIFLFFYYIGTLVWMFQIGIFSCFGLTSIRYLVWIME